MEQERIKLLLIDGGREHRGSNIYNGAAAVLGKWPSYIASAIWCIIFFLSLCLLIALLTFLLVLSDRFQRIEYSMESVPRRKLENEFCRRATNRNSRIAGYSQSLVNSNAQIKDSSENIFYTLTKDLNREEACSVESVLRLCPDKLVYLIFFDQKKSNRKIYENFLSLKYSNLNQIDVNGLKFVRSSPFEGQWTGDDHSILAAMVLTVWQFGGTAMRPNLIMINRGFIDDNIGYCKVDREMLFCPEQCSPYVYQLIETSVKALSKRNMPAEEIIDRSIVDFCSSSILAKVGCPGVSRIHESDMCPTYYPQCLFIRIDDLMNTTLNWELVASDFCPEVTGFKL